MAELTLQDLRRMGGNAVVKKYGKEYMSKLGKISAEKRRAKKQAQNDPLTTP